MEILRTKICWLLFLFKGALDKILKFSYWLNFIYQVNIDCSFTNTKTKIQKILPKVKKSSSLLSMQKVGMRLICIHVALQNMVILYENVIIHIIISYFCICSKTCTNKLQNFLPEFDFIFPNKAWKYTYSR